MKAPLIVIDSAIEPEKQSVIVMDTQALINTLRYMIERPDDRTYRQGYKDGYNAAMSSKRAVIMSGKKPGSSAERQTAHLRRMS